MPITTVSPTNVRDRVSHGGANIVLTGDPNTMWGDGSDTTSAYRSTSEPTNSTMLADIAAQPFASVVSATATMRVLLDSGNTDQRVDFWCGPLGSETPPGDFSWPNNVNSGVGTSGTDPVATPGVVTTLTGILLFSTATGVAMTPSQLTSLFSGGFTVAVARRPATGTAALTVYELTFQVEYLAPGSPPLRRWPPVNNNGFGPTRHHNPGPTRRAGGTY